MKVTPRHLETMRAAIAPLDTAPTRDLYRRRDIPRGDAVKDIDKRYRWDLLWASGAMRSLWAEEVEYADAHIDTALRVLVHPLEQAEVQA